MKYAYIKRMNTILKWYNSDFSSRKNLKKINPYWQISGKFLRPFDWKTHPDQMLHITYGSSRKIRMDEFSSKTVCVAPQN